MIAKRSGQLNYADYLASSHWREVRAAALKAAGYKCSQCGKHARRKGGGGLQVHHLSYEHIGAEPPEDLVVLCAYCHRRVEGRLYKREKALTPRSQATVRLPRGYVQPPKANSALVEANERLHKRQARRKPSSS